MSYLIDTSILVRLANIRDPQYVEANAAVVELYRRGEVLQVTSQVMIEFRAVATRPLVYNGLGLSLVDTEQLSATFEANFALLEETPTLFPAWKALVAKASIIGKQVHDARLVAICSVYGVTNILTYNKSHFARLVGHMAGIVVVHPASV